MKSRVVGLLAMVVVVVSSACATRVTPTLRCTSPSGGETFELGRPVTVSWTCSGCEAVVGVSGVAVYVVGVAEGDRHPIAFGGPTDSVTWIAGDTLGDMNLGPGEYFISLDPHPAFPQVAAANSGRFWLIVTTR